MYIRDVKLIEQDLYTNSQVTDEKVIAQIIASDLISEEKNNMTSGKNYYKTDNEEILNREFFYNLGEQKVKDTNKPNNKIVSSFFQVLVDQKIDYLLSKDFIINNLELPSNINIQQIVNDLALEASIKGSSWLFAYIDSISKKLEFKIIDSREIIPIYDNEYNQELKQVIRYYGILNTTNKGKNILYNVEVWDKEKVTYYIQDTEGNYNLDTSLDINPVFHYNVVTYGLGKIENIENKGFGVVPFIRFDNNISKQSDLKNVKSYIDCYDKLVSDFSNSIEELQDSVIKLINYGGESEQLDKFLEYLKRYKVIPLDDNGDMEYMTMNIPVEAKSKLIEILEKNIYKFGQGVDIDLVGAGNITNIVIKAKFAGLDLKCNKLEKEIKKFIIRLCEFLNKSGFMSIENINNFNIVFNRNIIINDNEKVEMCNKSVGIVSNKTILQNHPFVIDYEEELKNIEDEKEELKNTFNIGGDKDEEGTETREETGEEVEEREEQ